MPDINMSIFEEAQRNQLVTEVDIQTQVALDDYQVKLSDIANPTQAQDNVVIDRFGEFLPHWNESLDFDTWVKMSMEVAGKRILMLRGDSSVGSASNGNDVFVAWHGIATAEYLDTPSFVFDDLVYESRVKSTADAHYFRWGMQDVDNDWSDYTGIQIYSPQNNRWIITRTAGLETTPNETPTFTTDVYYKLKITNDGTTTRGYVDDDEIVSGTTTNHPAMNLGLTTKVTTGTMVQDWSFVRKYTTTEPIAIANTVKNIAIALKSLGRAG